MIRVLQCRKELDECRARLQARGQDFTQPSRARFWRRLYSLRYRKAAPLADFFKSWDVANTLEIVERAVPDRQAPILDMGCYNSEILWVFHGLGYRQLHGCDLNPLCRWMPYWHRIDYRIADLTKTPYPKETFAGITCLSVIEHGVDLQVLVAEVGRLLRPGGLFLFTTDYDGHTDRHSIPDDFRIFGQTWRIFDSTTLRGLIDRFTAAGFTLHDPAQTGLHHPEPPDPLERSRLHFRPGRAGEIMKRPRVVVVSGNGLPVVDGVCHYTANLLDNLAHARPDWDWFWLCKRPRWFHLPWCRHGTVYQIRPSHSWTRLGAGCAALAVRLLNPDILHIQEQIHSFHETDGACRIARAAPGKLAVTLHEFHIELPSVCHTISVVRQADVVIANDHRNTERCRQWAEREPDHEWWSPSNLAPPPPDWQVRVRPRLCVTFGFLNAIKSLNAVYEALTIVRQQYPDLRWRIIGPFRPDVDPHHAELARLLQGDWIEFPGGIDDMSDRRGRTWLAEADVMLLPFADGASPRRTTLQAAWRFGLPVVTTPPCVEEPSIRHEENCLLAPLETPQWAACLNRLFADPALHQRLRAGSQETAEEFSWDRLTSLHTGLYEELLQARHGSMQGNTAVGRLS